MTVLEFEAWVSDHYEELAEESRRITSDHPQALDCLHDVVEDMIEDTSRIPSDLRPIVFAVAVKNRVRNVIAHEALESSVAGQVGESIRLIGQADTFVDMTQTRHQMHKNNRRIRGRAPVGDVQGLKFDGGPGGSIRWRYQQIRDSRLFDERAIRSLADSIHKASARYRHAGEHGFSFTEFGQEPMQFGQEATR